MNRVKLDQTLKVITRFTINEIFHWEYRVVTTSLYLYRKKLQIINRQQKPRPDRQSNPYVENPGSTRWHNNARVISGNIIVKTLSSYTKLSTVLFR